MKNQEATMPAAIIPCCGEGTDLKTDVGQCMCGAISIRGNIFPLALCCKSDRMLQIRECSLRLCWYVVYVHDQMFKWHNPACTHGVSAAY